MPIPKEVFDKAGFGKRLKVLRKERGLSQEELAWKMTESGHSITRGAIGQFEVGINAPRPQTVEALALVLGCRRSDLFPDDLKETTIADVGNWLSLLPEADRLFAHDMVKALYQKHLAAKKNPAFDGLSQR